MLFLDVYEEYLLAKELQGVSPNTLERYKYSLRRVGTDLENPPIESVTTADLRRWLTGMTYGEVSRSIDIRNLRTFFNFATNEGYILDNPMTRIPTPKSPDIEPKALSDSVVQKIVHVSRKSPRDRAIVLCLLDSAVRATELCDLRREDVNLDTGVVQIRRGKGGKSRTAYIGPVTCRAIRVYLSRRKDDDPVLFLSQRGGPLDRNSLRLLLYRLCDRAGVDRAGPHRWRHTAATSLARQGCSSWNLSKILGHSDTRVSNIYIWLNDHEVQAAHRRFSPVASVLR
jgi:integrase/recombinase XerD